MEYLGRSRVNLSPSSSLKPRKRYLYFRDCVAIYQQIREDMISVQIFADKSKIELIDN